MKKFVIVCIALVCFSAVGAQEFKITDLAPVEEKGKWGFKQFGEWVINPRFEAAGVFEDGIAPVKMGGKWGFVDKTGKNVIPYKYEEAYSFSLGLSRVQLYGKWGFIDKTGTTVIPFKYDSALDFEDGLAQVSLAGKKGYVDKTGEWFDTKQDMLSSFSAFARHYVENDINEWQRKGKYEKLAQWQARVTDANRKARIDSLVVRAKEKFIATESRKINQDFEIVDYDTESEVFLVHDKRFGNLLVPVPISEAEQFENQFQTIHRFDTYCVNGDNLGLAQAIFNMPSGKTYKYTNDASLAYAQVDIDYNFEAVNFDIDEQQPQGTQALAARNLKVGQSDVDVKIPEMNIVNENTFALIISNENYKFVSKVPFANADGKTFEDYCIKTLGLPKDHIHRQEDATLGTFMGEVDWITNISKVFGGDARIIVYYAGHGIPDENTRDAFLLPVDGTGTNTKSAYKLSSKKLQKAEEKAAGKLQKAEKKQARAEQKLNKAELRARKKEARRQKKADRKNKLQESLLKVKNKIVHILGIPKRIYEKLKHKADVLRDFLEDEKNKKGIALCKKILVKALKAIAPRRGSGKLTIGTGNPSSTGYAMAGLAVLYAKLKGKLKVTPDFEQKIIEGEGKLKGRIYLITLLVLFCKLWFNKNFKALKESASGLKERLNQD